MDAVKIFSVDSLEKTCSLWHDKLLNGMIFAEREDNHRYIMYRVLACAYIKNYSHNIV